MIDQQAIHADMQRIFPSGAGASIERGIGRPATHALVAVSPPRKRLLGREGIAAAGFALAVTAIGLFAAPLLKTTPAAPPRVATITPAATVPAAAPAVVTAPVAAAPSALAAPIAAPAPLVAAAPSPAAVAHQARSYRARRAQVRRRVSARSVQQSVLARDRALTRQLNQQALRRMQAR